MPEIEPRNAANHFGINLPASPAMLRALRLNKERTQKVAEAMEGFRFAQEIADQCNAHRRRGQQQCGRCVLSQIDSVEIAAGSLKRGQMSSFRVAVNPDGPVPRVPRGNHRRSAKLKAKQEAEELARQRQREDEEAEKRLLDAAASTIRCTQKYVLAALQRAQNSSLREMVRFVDLWTLCQRLGFKGSPNSFIGRDADVPRSAFGCALADLLANTRFNARDIQEMALAFTAKDGTPVLTMSEVATTIVMLQKWSGIESWFQYFYASHVLASSVIDGSEASVTLLELQTLLYIASEASGTHSPALDRLKRHLHRGSIWAGTTSLLLSTWEMRIRDEDPELANMFRPTDWDFPFSPANRPDGL